ncbi:MAG: hypothetical protein HN465_01905, partial [Nitrospina sp.]|nr:hypothetical protein [Nitrospina sp.]
GFPAIPVKILRPKVEVDLIESQRKRANFLKTTIRSIKLSNIQCFHGRVADFPEFVGKYDFVTLRHVVEPKLSLHLGVRLLRDGGSLVLQTSRDYFFQPDFLDALLLSLTDEIIFEGSDNSHSKVMVLKRSLI